MKPVKMTFHFNSLTKKDIEYGLRLLEEEKISPLTSENMFEKLIYCILSTTENYQKQKAIHIELKRNGLNTSAAILDNKPGLEIIVGKSRFPNSKIKHIYNLASYWQDSFLPQKIIQDFSNNKYKEFELRESVAKEVPGIGHKCASLFMNYCGYENVVALDIWMLRFLESRGLIIKMPDYKTRGFVNKREYLEYEKIFQGMAQERGFTPAEFQAILWCKYSSFRPMYDQLELFKE